MSSKYIPDRGDIIWIDFNPQSGHEQAKRRPALVLSPKQYNKKTSLSILCPITSKIKNYPFEVGIRLKDQKSVVLADQIKSLDWMARQAKFIQKTETVVLEEVLGKLSALVFI